MIVSVGHWLYVCLLLLGFKVVARFTRFYDSRVSGELKPLGFSMFRFRCPARFVFDRGVLVVHSIPNSMTSTIPIAALEHSPYKSPECPISPRKTL